MSRGRMQQSGGTWSRDGRRVFPELGFLPPRTDLQTGLGAMLRRQSLRRPEKIRAEGHKARLSDGRQVGFDRDDAVGPPVTVLQDQLVQLLGRSCSHRWTSRRDAPGTRNISLGKPLGTQRPCFKPRDKTPMRSVHDVLAAGNRHSAIAGKGAPDAYAVIHDRYRAGNRLGGYLAASTRIHRLGDDKGDSQGLRVRFPQRLDNIIRVRLGTARRATAAGQSPTWPAPSP